MATLNLLTDDLLCSVMAFFEPNELWASNATSKRLKRVGAELEDQIFERAMSRRNLEKLQSQFTKARCVRQSALTLPARSSRWDTLKGSSTVASCFCRRASTMVTTAARSPASMTPSGKAL